MSKSITCCLGIIHILFLLPSALLAQPDRITAPIDAGRTVVLKGNVHPNAQPRFHQGPVEPSFRLSYITLMLKKTDAQQAALEQLLEEQQNPASPSYHDWLTPEQYADRFGLSQHDMDGISAWLQSEGFTVEYTARGRNWLAFSGTAGQVRAAFHTELHRYRVDGESHFAAAAEPSVPASLEPVVAGLAGLDDFYPRAPKHPLPAYTDGTGMHSLVPDDIATIYDISKLYQTNVNGAGQSIVVVGQSAINSSDIQGFRNKYNLPTLSLQTKAYPADPGTTDDMVEGDLDLEWAGAVARNATLIYVYGRSALSAVLYAIDNNLAPVISESFGDCEAQFTSSSSSYYRSEAQKASAQGITWLVSSGDSGAADCDYNAYFAVQGLAVDFPASIPEVTAVGGTQFNDGNGGYWNTTNGPNGGSAMSYIPEMAWNETAVQWELAATGGGASSLYPKPPWQNGAGVPSDGARDLPDLSLAAGVYNDAYNVLTGGSWWLYGGTSASTPVFAGIVTLLNHYLVANRVQSKPGVGNINPTLYHLAQSAPNAFHDITVGNNIVPCMPGTPNCTTGQFGYSAGPGYDLSTGLGSVDAYYLVTQWNGSTSGATTTTTTVTANPASIMVSSSTTLTATVKASSGSTTPTGSVSFTLGGKLLGATNLSGSSGTATASLYASGSWLTVGNNSITASYSGSTSFGASSGLVTVTVTVPAVATTTTVTASPTSFLVSGSTTLTATVKASSSGSTTPTGSVSFTLGGTLLGAANLSGSSGAATASLYVSGSWLIVGNNSITGSYGGSTGFGASSGWVTVTVTVPVVATTTTVAANPTSISVSGSTTLTATVKAGSSGSTTPTGSVSFTLGNTFLGAANLFGSTGVATASLYVSGSRLTAGDNSITGSYSGDTSSGASSGSVTVTVPLPSIKSVTNAASYATGAVSPGEMVTIFGTAIGPATAAGATTDPATGRLATTIGGVQVLFKGIPAPMIYASSGQVSAVVPYEMAGIATPPVWIKYAGQTSNAFQVTSTTTAPGLFTQNASGSGPGSILNQDYSPNGPNNPAAKGSIVMVYMTGEGQTSPLGVTGAITAATLPPPQVTPAPLLAIGVLINGQPALYVYAGEAPGLVAGMMQLNVQIPSTAPSGNLPITVSIGGNISLSNVTVSVK